MIWLQAKTDWQPTDYINVEDFNRIRNNIGYVQELANRFFNVEKIQLGAEKTYNDLPYPEVWNNLEDILDSVVEVWPIEGSGFKKTYYPLGDYIDYNELNRLERVTSNYKEFLENQEIPMLSFELGNYGGIRI